MSKCCTRCKVVKTFDQFGKEPRMRDGHTSHCKECRNALTRAWVASEAGSKRVKEYSQEYYEQNKEREQAQGLEYHRKNRAAILPKMRERAVDRYRENEEHQAKCKAYARSWRVNNRAADNCLSRQKQMRKRQAMPKWLGAIQKAQIREFYEVAVAISMQTGVEHDVDHIFALKGKSWRGLHVPWNLRVIPSKENNQKLNKPAKEFAHIFWSAA